MKWFKYLERNFHAYSVMWKTMTFTKNRYLYALALTFMWSWQSGRCGGCGIECNKGIFFSRLWNKGMNEFNDISTVPWPFRHWPWSPKIMYRMSWVGGKIALTSVPVFPRDMAPVQDPQTPIFRVDSHPQIPFAPLQHPYFLLLFLVCLDQRT